MQIKIDYEDDGSGKEAVDILPASTNTTTTTQDSPAADPTTSTNTTSTGASTSVSASGGQRVVSRCVHVPGALALLVVVDECCLDGTGGDEFAVLDGADTVVCTRSGSQCSPMTPNAPGLALVRVQGDKATLRVTIAGKGSPQVTVENQSNGGSNEPGKEEEKEGSGTNNTTSPNPGASPATGAGAAPSSSPPAVAVVRKYSVRFVPTFTVSMLSIHFLTLLL